MNHASCGHVLQPSDGPDGMGFSIMVRIGASENHRSVRYKTVCGVCKQALLEAGVVLADEFEANAWLAGQGSSKQPVD